jgi:hypothetical protein
MDYEPTELHDANGFCVYNEINTGQWWWEIQGKISAGSILILILFASDKTQLTNYSRDKSG